MPTSERGAHVDAEDGVPTEVAVCPQGRERQRLGLYWGERGGADADEARGGCINLLRISPSKDHRHHQKSLNRKTVVCRVKHFIFLPYGEIMSVRQEWIQTACREVGVGER